MWCTRCDSINLDGTTKPPTHERGSYGHGQKMRAAMTYAFGRLQGLGNMPWHESELRRGDMLGNPSVSIEVSSYMCSLRRRKVSSLGCAADVSDTLHLLPNRSRQVKLPSVHEPSPRSASSLFSHLSLTDSHRPQHILKKIYHFNHIPGNWAIRDYQPGGHGSIVRSGTDSGDLPRWAGGRMRRFLHAAYTIAFLCMLRSDEVLKIQSHDLKLFSNGLVLTLPFRKTHQLGGG